MPWFKHIAFGVMIVFLQLSTQSLWACSTCFSAQEQSLLAYYGTTILLTLLPFGLLTAIGYWIYRQQKTRKIS